MVESKACNCLISQADYIVQTWNVAPRTAELMVEAGVQPAGPVNKRFSREVLRDLIAKKDFFLKTEDPESLLTAFQSARQAGLHPPNWVVDALSGAFQHLLEGRPDFIHWLLGLKVGTGGTPHEQKRINEERDFILMTEIVLLFSCCGYSRDAAFGMIQTKIDNGGYLGVDNLEKLNAKTIRDLFYKTQWARNACDKYLEAVKAGKCLAEEGLFVESMRKSRDMDLFLKSFSIT